MKTEAAGSKAKQSLILFGLVIISVLGFVSGFDPKGGIYIAVMLGGLGYLILCIVWPFAAFSLLIFLGLMVWLSSIPFLSNFSILVAVGMAFMSLWIIRLMSRQTKLILLREFWLFLGFLLVIGLSMMLNWGGPAGLGSTFTYVQLLLLPIIVVNFATSSAQLRSLGYVFILASTLIALIILLDQASILPDGLVLTIQSTVTIEGTADQFERSGGVWGDPNFSALHLLVALPFIIELWGGSTRAQKAILAFSALTIFWGLRYTYSMGGMIGLITIVFLKTWLTGKHNPIKLTLQLILGSTVGWWLVFNFLPKDYWARILVNLDMFQGLLTNHDEWSFLNLGTTRGDTWLAALKTFSQAPVWGHGPGNSIYLNPWHSVFHFFVPRLGAHNFLLSIAGDFGVTGLLVFIILILVALRACWPGKELGKPLKPIRNAVFIALISSIVQGMAIDMQSQKLLWVLIGMSFVIGRLSKIIETEPNITRKINLLHHLGRTI